MAERPLHTRHGLLTEVQLEAPDGERVSYVQLGGFDGRVREHVFHAPPLPVVGDEVEVDLDPGKTARGLPRYALRQLQFRRALPGGFRIEELGRRNGDVASSTGYVRGLSTAGNPWHWPSDCVFVTYGKEEGDRLPTEEQIRILDGTLATWETESASCSSLRFIREGPFPAEVVQDYETVVVFREDRWCTPATDETPEICHQRGEIALTHVRFIDDGSGRDGEIVDADIEVNAVDDRFTGDPQADPDTVTDLASVMTHELGHVMGLAHVCLMRNDDPRATDAAGNPRKRCFDPTLPEHLRRATMFGTYGRRDTWMASPEPVDVAGVCAIFPEKESPRCERPGPTLVEEGCGCRLAPSENAASRSMVPSSGWLRWSGLVTAAGLLWLRRRRARSDRAGRGRRASEGR